MTRAETRFDREDPVTDADRATSPRTATRRRFPRATLMNVHGGLLIAGIDPDRAELVAERLARWIPGHALTHDPAAGLWTIVAPWSRTARAVALVTTGTILELFDTSYVKGRARLERAIRWERTGGPGRGAA